MKITKSQLRKIIKEELFKEAGGRYDYDIQDEINAKIEELEAARNHLEKENIQAEINKLYDELDTEMFRDKRQDRRPWATGSRRGLPTIPRSLG